MWSQRLSRISAVSLIIFGVLQAFAGVIDPDKNDPAVIGSPVWMLFHSAMFIGYLFAVVGVVGLFLHYANTGGWLGIGALILTLFANVLLVMVTFFQGYAMPMVVRSSAVPVTVNGLRYTLNGPLGSGYLVVFVLAGACFFFGYLMTALAVRRTGRFPPLFPWLLIAGNALGFVEFVVPALTAPATLLSGLVFDAGIIGLGAWMLRRGESAER